MELKNSLGGSELRTHYSSASTDELEMKLIEAQATQIELLQKRNTELENELERERLRLAACGVAALGYFNGCHPDYDSASLQDVLRLYNKNRAESSSL